MLATTLWFVIAVGVLAAIVLDGAATFARAGVHAAAEHLAASAQHAAIAAYQQRLAASADADPAAQALQAPAPFSGAAPSIGALAQGVGTLTGTLPDQGPSNAFSVTYAVTPTTVAAPSCAPGPSAGGTDTIAWLQCNGFVRESRMSLRVTIRVSDAAQRDLYVQRDVRVALRLFARYPYSAVVGAEDDAADGGGAGSPGAHEGDLGGGTVSGVPPPSPATGSPPGGTLVHVEYRCVPGPAYDCSGASPPDPDGDLRADAAWQDGNAARAP